MSTFWTGLGQPENRSIPGIRIHTPRYAHILRYAQTQGYAHEDLLLFIMNMV